jgi:hypothetical protein
MISPLAAGWHEPFLVRSPFSFASHGFPVVCPLQRESIPDFFGIWVLRLHRALLHARKVNKTLKPILKPLLLFYNTRR